jgi:hypothetical protein
MEGRGERERRGGRVKKKEKRGRGTENGEKKGERG